MNKDELVKEVAKRTGLTQAVTRKCLDGLLEVISETLKKEEEVRLVGFGTFRVIKRKERRGRDPRSRKEIIIPAKKVVRFSPGKNLEL